MTQNTTKKPVLDGASSHEELDLLCLEHAKYFTVVQCTLGGFAQGGNNYHRREAPNLQSAEDMADAWTKQSGKKCMIYAVVDFIGANDFSRHIKNIPPTPSPFKAKRTRQQDSLKSGQVQIPSELIGAGRALP